MIFAVRVCSELNPDSRIVGVFGRDGYGYNHLRESASHSSGSLRAVNYSHHNDEYYYRGNYCCRDMSDYHNDKDICCNNFFV